MVITVHTVMLWVTAMHSLMGGFQPFGEYCRKHLWNIAKHISECT